MRLFHSDFFYITVLPCFETKCNYMEIYNIQDFPFKYLHQFLHEWLSDMH